VRADLIEVFKIVRGLLSIKLEAFLELQKSNETASMEAKKETVQH